MSHALCHTRLPYTAPHIASWTAPLTEPYTAPHSAPWNAPLTEQHIVPHSATQCITNCATNWAAHCATYCTTNCTRHTRHSAPQAETHRCTELFIQYALYNTTNCLMQRPSLRNILHHAQSVPHYTTNYIMHTASLTTQHTTSCPHILHFLYSHVLGGLVYCVTCATFCSHDFLSFIHCDLPSLAIFCFNALRIAWFTASHASYSAPVLSVACSFASHAQYSAAVLFLAWSNAWHTLYSVPMLSIACSTALHAPYSAPISIACPAAGAVNATPCGGGRRTNLHTCHKNSREEFSILLVFTRRIA